MAAMIPDETILESLQRVKTGRICTDQEIARNFSLIKNILINIVNNITNVYNNGSLMARVTTAGGCARAGGLEPEAEVTSFTPMYDPGDFPDIETPTHVSNPYGLPAGNGVAFWDANTEEWVLGIPTFSQASWLTGPLALDGMTLSWGTGGGFVAGDCGDGGSDSLTFPTTDMDVLYSIARGSSGGCSIDRTRTTLKVFGLPQTIGSTDPAFIFEAVSTLTDVAMGEGAIVGSTSQVYVGCSATGPTEELIPITNCSASAGSSMGA